VTIGSIFQKRSASYQGVWGSGDSWTDMPGGSASIAKQLAITATLACVDIKAASIMSMPLHEYQPTGDGRTKLNKSQILDNPSAVFSAEEWLYACSASLSLWDEAIGFITAVGRDGWATQMEWVNPDDVGKRKVGGRVLYDYAGGPHEKWPNGPIVHIRRRPLPGSIGGGASIGKALEQVVTLGTEGAKAQVASYLAGGLPLAHLAWDGELDATKAEETAKRFEASRTTNPGRPFTTGRGWSLTPIPRGDFTADMVAMRERIATEIAVAHSVAPELVGGTTGSSMTYSTLEGVTRSLEVRALYPVYVAMERTFSRNLLPGSRFCKFNADATVRTSLADRYKAHDTAIRAGMASPDERRALEDESPIPNGAGAVFLWPPYATTPTPTEVQQ
jgi:phage portal protein BeeE